MKAFNGIVHQGPLTGTYGAGPGSSEPANAISELRTMKFVPRCANCSRTPGLGSNTTPIRLMKLRCASITGLCRFTLFQTATDAIRALWRSEEHTAELQSRQN